MSEWLRLDWEDIDLDTRLIYFRKTKTKHPREVPIGAGTLMEKLILAQHDMRRLANRWMRDRRVAQPIRMYIMGHRTGSMDIRYGIVDRVSLDAAQDAVKTHATNLAAH
jgi:integrase